MQQEKTDKSTRPFDLVLYGATSFVGKYAAEYLLARAKKEGVRWAVAGRDREKMEALKRSLGAADIPCIIADAADENALAVMARQTKVVASTVGPYALYGSSLVKACVDNGTDYCDLTAEVQWMRSMIDRHQSKAEKTGSRIVHACGFDSVPSDLGCWYLQQQSINRFGEPCIKVNFRLKKASGGFSGGTTSSLSGMVAAGAENKAIRALLLNPYALTNKKDNCVQKDRFTPAFDKTAGEWSAPFIMAPVNSRVVQRSHYLAGQPWGEDFIYDEAMLTGKGVLGIAMSAGVTGALGALVGLTAFKKTRPLMQKILPAPGKGPSQKSIENGFFEIHGYGNTRGGKRLKVVVKGNRDPGYGATSRMLVESALSLAADSNNNQVRGGFWTPSTAIGDALLNRLQTHAGISFGVSFYE